MATAAAKATSLTKLKIGGVEVPIALFSTVDKPGKTPEGFTTAGPNGGKLMARAIARPVPDETPRDELDEGPMDPLAVDESANRVEQPPLARIDQGRDIAQPRAEIFGMSEVDGEYGRELVEEGSGEIVKAGNIRRGVRLEDGRFIDCTSQLAEVDERTRLDVADVVAFVDATKIARSRVKASYYIGTDDPKAPHALRIVFEGLRRSRRAAIVKLTKKSRQTLGAIVPLRDTLVLLDLVFAEDVRPAPKRALRHLDAEVKPEEVATFCGLVEAMSRPPWLMDEMRDDAIALREELFARAMAGEVPETLVPARPREEQDLLAQLEASLAAVGAGA